MIRSLLAFFLSLFVISCATECGRKKDGTYLIAGGDHTEPGDWPWLVSLHQSKNGKYFCGSSLINEKLLVTGERKALIYTRVENS